MAGKPMEKQERKKSVVMLMKIPIPVLTLGLRKRFKQSPSPGRRLLTEHLPAIFLKACYLPYLHNSF